MENTPTQQEPEEENFVYVATAEAFQFAFTEKEEAMEFGKRAHEAIHKIYQDIIGSDIDAFQGSDIKIVIGTSKLIF